MRGTKRWKHVAAVLSGHGRLTETRADLGSFDGYPRHNTAAAVGDDAYNLSRLLAQRAGAKQATNHNQPMNA